MFKSLLGHVVPTKVSREEAIAIAKAKVGEDGRVVEVEIEMFRGKLTWDVEIVVRKGILNVVEHDVYVDASTGKVVKHTKKRRLL
jgi:uncharacterized membrane protein YkoI